MAERTQRTFRERFWLGGLGALLPLLLTLYGADYVAFIQNPYEIPLGVYIGTSIRYAIGFALGGIYTAVFHSDINRASKLIQFGVTAPAVLATFINAHSPAANAKHDTRHPSSGYSASQPLAMFSLVDQALAQDNKGAPVRRSASGELFADIWLGLIYTIPNAVKAIEQRTVAPIQGPAIRPNTELAPNTSRPSVAPNPQPGPPIVKSEAPACGGNIVQACVANSGDTAWMLSSAAIVLMMTIPGIGLFYGGMVRKKNVGDTIMTSFAITCIVSLIWIACGYSIALRSGSSFIGGLDRAFLQGILIDVSNGTGNPSPLAPTIPEAVYISFELMFAIVASALIAGAYAERMKFSAMLWFAGLWSLLVYGPVAHWIWGPDGFMSLANPDASVRMLDFAGGAVVHMSAGVSGLVCALVLGKRRNSGPAHNLVLTFIGAGLLWVGWFGFNAGSAMTAGTRAAMAMLTTQCAAATSAYVWMMVEWVHRGKPTVIGICTGAVAGLVAISPASGFVGPLGALAIGASSAVLCYWGVTALKHMFGYDDALDAFGVHGIGGAAGVLLTGVYAIEQYGGVAGLLEGNPGQLLSQVVGILTVCFYTGVASFVILKIIDVVVGLRVAPDVEIEGLDIALHGEAVDGTIQSG